MNKKLTITLNENVIKNAKKYAKENEISLSKLIENYLHSIVENKTKKVEITSLVESLSGVIDLPTNYDYQEEHTNYLIEKHK